MKLATVLTALLVSIFAISACAPQATPTAAPMPEPTATTAPVLLDIVDTAVANGSFTTLAAALQAAGLVDALKAEGPFTVFAPTDEAFAKLPAGTIEELLKPENIEQLKSILLYHVVEGKVMAADVAGITSATALSGNDLAVKVDMGNVYINESKVVLPDVEASNGVIHVIDTVLLPPAALSDIVDTAVADGRFTTLAAALQAAGLVEPSKGKVLSLSLFRLMRPLQNFLPEPLRTC